jgi:hypothetical protein
MAIPSGLAASVGIITETTEGTAATPTHFWDLNSESMKLDKNVVQGKGLRAPASGYSGLFMRSSRRVVGSWGAKGGIQFDACYNSLGMLFEHMMGSFGNFSSCVQQASSTAYLQTHTPGPQFGNTFTMQIGKPDTSGTVDPFTYVGCKVVDWTLSTEVNKMATFDVTVDAWQELTPDNPQGTTAGPSYTTPTYTTGEQFFHFREATIYNSGTLSNTGTNPIITSLASPTAAARVTKAQIKVTNPLDTARYFIAGTGGTGGSGVAGVKSEQLENEYRTVGGTLSVEFFSRSSYYDVFAGDTSATLELIFTGPTAIASTYYPTLSILIPNIHYDGESPVVAGPGIINVDLPFSGLDNEANNPIQIQYMSSDSAF